MDTRLEKKLKAKGPKGKRAERLAAKYYPVLVYNGI